MEGQSGNNGRAIKEKLGRIRRGAMGKVMGEQWWGNEKTMGEIMGEQ